MPTVAGLAVHLGRRYPEAVARLCGAEAPNDGTDEGARVGGGPSALERVQGVDAALGSDDFDEGRI